MKLNKKLFLILALGSLPASAFAAQANEPTAEEIYNNLKDEFIVEFTATSNPILGTQVMQKNNPTGSPSFCRRTNQDVPFPIYSYECFYQTMTGKDAEALYSGSAALELEAAFRSTTGGWVQVGGTWKEKNIGSSDATICVKTELSVPFPVPAYTCYANSDGSN